jgi:hypothetical protein
MKTLYRYLPLTIVTTVTTATIASYVCVDVNANMDDIECNIGNTPQTAMDIAPSTEGQIIQQSNVEHICNLQQLTFNVTIIISLNINPQIAQSTIATHIPSKQQPEDALTKVHGPMMYNRAV